MKPSPRILIVDDEEELVSALTERLNMRGFEAVGVTTGAEALDRVERESFDVVLLDLKMPGLGGLEVTKRIKSKNARIQVVMLTGHGSTQAVEEVQRLGAFDYVMKPVKIEELVRILLSAVPNANSDGNS